MRLGSLFDGSGGFPLAAELSGIEPVWASEVEPFPIMVTRKHFPNMKHLGDVSKINGAEIEHVDIITFGSPCQDLSVAGKQEGLSGGRSSLFFEAIRIIKEMREATYGVYPTYMVWENVPGAFGSNGGRDFHAVLTAVCGIKEEVSIPRLDKWRQSGEIVGSDWSVAWRTLDAQYWGVPQRRKRIFLVADFSGGGAGKILFESEGLSRYSAESQRAWQDSARSSENSIGEAGGVVNLNFNPTDSRLKIDESDVSQTLTQRMGTGGNQVPLVMNSSGGGIAGTIDANYYKGAGQREGKEREYVAVAIDTSHADDVARVSDTVGTLQERDYKGGKLVAYKESSFGGFSEGIGTLRAKSGVAGGGSETLIVTDVGE